MEAIPRISNRLLSYSSLNPISKIRINPFLHFTPSQIPICPNSFSPARFPPKTLNFSSSADRSRLSTPRAGWLLGLGQKGQKSTLPEIVKAGDPVLHEPAREVDPNEIGSEKIQKIVDDMISVMRDAPGVGLAAPQLGVPLKIIVLEDTKEYISYAPKEEIKSQDRRAFDLLV
ncbi:hypothetical protein RND81_09G123400 [Saponaria officinalis]